MSKGKQPNIILKLALLGDPAVGKTSLINRYVDHKFENDYQPTLGVNIVAKKVIIEERNIEAKLILWDIAGQERYDLSRQLFFQGCWGALFVYDITRDSTFSNIKSKWLCDLKKYGKDNAVFILIANKKDLKEERVISKKEGETFAREISANDFIETSAKNGNNVEKAFKNLVQRVLSRSTKTI